MYALSRPELASPPQAPSTYHCIAAVCVCVCGWVCVCMCYSGAQQASAHLHQLLDVSLQLRGQPLQHAFGAVHRLKRLIHGRIVLRQRLREGTSLALRSLGPNRLCA